MNERHGDRQKCEQSDDIQNDLDDEPKALRPITKKRNLSKGNLEDFDEIKMENDGDEEHKGAAKADDDEYAIDFDVIESKEQEKDSNEDEDEEDDDEEIKTDQDGNVIRVGKYDDDEFELVDQSSVPKSDKKKTAQIKKAGKKFAANMQYYWNSMKKKETTQATKEPA